MPNFDETMENSRIFLTYSLSMTMLGKSAQILAERGADPVAMSFITTGIELLSSNFADMPRIRRWKKNLKENWKGCAGPLISGGRQIMAVNLPIFNPKKAFLGFFI